MCCHTDVRISKRETDLFFSTKNNRLYFSFIVSLNSSNPTSQKVGVHILKFVLLQMHKGLKVLFLVALCVIDCFSGNDIKKSKARRRAQKDSGKSVQDSDQVFEQWREHGEVQKESGSAANSWRRKRNAGRWHGNLGRGGEGWAGIEDSQSFWWGTCLSRVLKTLLDIQTKLCEFPYPKC